MAVRALFFLFSALCLVSCTSLTAAPNANISSFYHSSSSGTEYFIQVYLPSQAVNSTLYVLDGDETFAKVHRGGSVSYAVVAIGYGSGSNERTRDYTPIAVDGEGGGIDAFLDYLETELVPEVEARYTLPGGAASRVLSGHSFGGLAVLTALLRDRGVFSSFHVSSPSLWWGGNVIFERVDTWLASQSLTPVRLWASVGGIEAGAMNALFSALQARFKAAGLDESVYQFTVLPDKKHYEAGSPSRLGALTAWGMEE